MLLFGHMGIGYKLSQLIKTKIKPSLKGILIGSLLPDIIDKPLYFILVCVTGRQGEELGFINGTRTFAHTGLFFMILFILTFYKRNIFFICIVIGQFTHLLLDCLSTYILWPDKFINFFIVFFWPLLGIRFPPTELKNFHDAEMYYLNPFLIGFEVIGIVCLMPLLFKRK